MEIPAAETPTEPVLLTLPLSHLASLLFGEFADSEFHPSSRPLSLCPGDLATVRICRVQIGQLLALVDKEEVMFHVEIFPAQAEIWLIKEWMESNARRRKRAEKKEVYDKEKATFNLLVSILVEHLTIYSIPVAYAQALSFQLATNYKTTDFSTLIKAWRLEEAFAEFEQRKGEV